MKIGIHEVILKSYVSLTLFEKKDFLLVKLSYIIRPSDYLAKPLKYTLFIEYF